MTKDLHRMQMDHCGPPGPPDDHLSKRVLGNIWSVLEPLGDTLKGSKMFKMVLVIFGNIRVLTEERWKSFDIVQKSFGGFRKRFGVSRELNNKLIDINSLININKTFFN
jgi:hypothetical protein